jgi:hypothetical protein
MNELEARARELIDVARAGHGASAADAERVRAKLRARVLAEPLLIEPLSAPSPPSGWLRKLLAVFAAGGGAGFAAGFWVAQTFGAAAQSAALAPVPGADGAAQASAVPSLATSEGAQPSQAPREASAAPAPNPLLEAPGIARGTSMAEASARGELPRAKVPAPERGTRRQSSLEAELEGLRRAQELLHKGDAKWALARLDELDRSSTSSVLLDERRATRAMAECALGVSASCAKTKPETGPKGDARQTESGGSRHE